MRAAKLLLVALIAGGCSVVVISTTHVLGQEPAPAPRSEYFPRPTEREVRLDVALDQLLTIDFQEMPLADVAAWFSSKLESPVILDHRSLENAGIAGDAPVTRKVGSITARAALKLVLGDLDLASVQKCGVLTITTQDSAEADLVTRVYPVEDLTPLVEHRHSPGPVGKSAGGGMVSKNATGPGNVVAEPREKKHAPRAAKAAPDYDSLIEVITTTVKPQTWDEVGGPGSISEMLAAKSIVVSQTQEVHDEVLVLLRALRAAKLAGAPTGGE